jgi:hypothetical protein
LASTRRESREQKVSRRALTNLVYYSVKHEFELYIFQLPQREAPSNKNNKRCVPSLTGRRFATYVPSVRSISLVPSLVFASIFPKEVAH